MNNSKHSNDTEYYYVMHLATTGSAQRQLWGEIFGKYNFCQIQ